MDNLEKYIRANREQFDESVPDPAVWERISSRLPEKRDDTRRVTMWKWLSVAAVTFALVMCGVVAGIYMGRDHLAQNPAYVEFQQAQRYYNVEYNKKKSELAKYAYDPEVDEDLQEMDKMYNDLSREFLNTDEPDKMELINAMIQVYKSRISLLERVLNRIEKTENTMQTSDDDENIKI